MPHEINEPKSKWFMFDLLTKKHRVRSNLTGSNSIDLFNSVFRNEPKKLFLDSKIIKQLESINSTILISGYLRGKTNFRDEKKNYFILRKYNNEIKNKFLLECYKDSSFKKAKYIIDVDYVDQIDLRDTENRIILTRANEYCCLDAGDKKNTFNWLNKICKNCGFDEITNSFDQDEPKLNKKLNKTSKKIESNNTSIRDKSSNFEANTTKTNSNSSKSNSNSISASNSSSNKPVAGIASLSVGSFHMKLDNIFKKKTNDSLKTRKSSVNSHQGNESESRKENYVFLKECMSGLDKEDKSNKCDKKSNKNGKLNFLDSFNSLDMISQRKLGKFLDENSIKVDHSSNTINNDSIMIDMDSNSEATGFKTQNSDRLKIQDNSVGKIHKSNSFNPENDQYDCDSINKQLKNKRINSFSSNENQYDDRYINYSTKFDDELLDINNNNNTSILRYVPLEIIENPKIFYTKVYSDDSPKNLNSILASQDINKEYTDWDASRTKALNQTKIHAHIN